MRLNPVFIKARDIPDAWHQLVFSILENGRKFKIDKGSYAGQDRLEFDFVTVQITHPTTRPLEPEIPASLGIPNPVEPGYIEEYLPYLMTDKKEKDEDYTYGDRIASILEDHYLRLTDRTQIEEVIHTYKVAGYRNNQMVLQVAHPSDLWLGDPPCLRHIDTRIQDGKLHFFPYFRSWDLWNGFPANLGGIVYLMEYMAEEIGVECGEFICASKGLHLYDYVWELAELRRMKPE